MKQLAGQMSIFELMQQDETPTIPFEKQKRGMKGWVIEIQGIFLVENGFKKNMVGVTAKQVVLDMNSYTRKNCAIDRIEQWQGATCTGKGGGCKGDGWIGSPRKLYAKQPKWWELQEYVRQNYRKPYDEIVYTYKDGHACLHIGDYERKGA